MSIYIHGRRKELLMVCNSIEDARKMLQISWPLVHRAVRSHQMVGGGYYVTRVKVVSRNWKRTKPDANGVVEEVIEVPGKNLMTYYPSRFSDHFGGYRELYSKFQICEKHYNECKQSGKLHYTLDFDGAVAGG